MPANLNPSYAPIGGGGRTIAIGVPDDLPTGYHWVRNLLNGQTTGGSQTSYSTGTNNSNFTEGSTNCLSAVYAKDAGNTGPGALQFTVFLGCIKTGADPEPPTVNVYASTMPGQSGLIADYSGDGLVQQFRCKVSTTPGVGESGLVTIAYAPPAGFKGLMWYEINVIGYVSYLAVNGNGSSNSLYNLRGVPNSRSGWDRGGGIWKGSQRALVYPISNNLTTSVVSQYSTSPNFAIGENNNADGVNSLSIYISRDDQWDSTTLARTNSNNPTRMNIASGYATEYGYGTNGQVYVAASEGVSCVPYRPANSVQLDTIGTYANQEDNAPKPSAYVLTQNQCPGTSYEDQWYFTSASTSILQTNVTVTVWLEKAPDPIPIMNNNNGVYCYATGGTVTINGSNFTNVNKVYGYGGQILTGATVNVISDTEAEVTLPTNTFGTIGLGIGTGNVGYTTLPNGGCASGVPNYNPVYNPPSPAPVPTPTPPNTNVCMGGWTFGIKTNTTYLWDGPKIVSYDGTVFMAPNAGTWTVNAIETCLDFNIQDVYLQNGTYLNPGAGEIIQIIDWGYPYDGSYYVYSNSLLGTVQRRLQLSCTNTSPTPTPSPIQTGTCIAPANTNNGPFAFPTSPTLNEIYSFHGRAWYWNSYAWNRYCVGVTPISTTSPALSLYSSTEVDNYGTRTQTGTGYYGETNYILEYTLNDFDTEAILQQSYQVEVPGYASMFAVSSGNNGTVIQVQGNANNTAGRAFSISSSGTTFVSKMLQIGDIIDVYIRLNHITGQYGNGILQPSSTYARFEFISQSTRP